MWVRPLVCLNQLLMLSNIKDKLFLVCELVEILPSSCVIHVRWALTSSSVIRVVASSYGGMNVEL